MELDDFKGRRPSFLGYFVCGLLGAVVGGFLLLSFGPATLFSRFDQIVPNNTTLPMQQLQQQIQQTEEFQQVKQIIASGGGGSATTAAERVAASVVGITTTTVQRDAYFRSKKVQGVGSGVIVDVRGYILTNNHVAGGNVSAITISLIDGRTVSGKTIWTDPTLDLAIVKIDSTDNLIAAPLGDSKNITVGQDAIAIGNPLGLRFQRSVTGGIVSALSRTIEIEDGVYMDNLIQTDASINPGNSGGPLVNGNGEVIGINTIKVTTAEGMGFAIPINVAKPIIQNVIEDGAYKTPIFGAIGFDRELASFIDAKIDCGIYVSKVLKNTPAEKAGLKAGDLILNCNGSDINTMVELKEVFYSLGAGKDLNLKVKGSDGNTRDVKLVLAAGK
ncbi:MAG: trypsin-like serine protease [Clostridiales bacterium]|nr:trypsin-like serine protease [Clostridiales bacterium]